MKATGRRITHWLLFLQQFDFTIAYEKELITRMSMHCLGDLQTTTLQSLQSGHVLPYLTLIPLPKHSKMTHNWLTSNTMSNKAPFHNTVLKGSVNALSEMTSCVDNIKTPPLRWQTVVPPNLRTMVLREVHNNLGHFGTQKTFDQVKTRFYWPGYGHDVEYWVKRMWTMSEKEPRQPNPPVPLGTLQATALLRGIMGPLPISSQGNKYILVITGSYIYKLGGGFCTRRHNCQHFSNCVVEWSHIYAITVYLVPFTVTKGQTSAVMLFNASANC